MQEQDVAFMQEALSQAKVAALHKEVPVGAVVVCDGVIVGWGYNQRESKKNALCHAELCAIAMACQTLGGWRLHRCTLYVTMEPCLMCAGAILHARIARVVYGIADEKFGAFGSVVDVNQMGFPMHTEVEAGVLDKESKALVQSFFAELRKEKKKQKEEQRSADSNE